MFLAQTFSLILPILIPGLAFIAIIKKRLFSALNRPIDNGLKINHRPLLGPNKTWRGPAVYTIGAILVCLILHTHSNLPYIHPIFATSPIPLGIIYGVSYNLGELINSFIKRRLNIPSGRTNTTLQKLLDASDGVLTSSLALSLIYGAIPLQLLLVIITATAIHLSADSLMKKLSLKK
jgi:hypothetical protein